MSEKEEGKFDFTADPKRNFTNYLIWQMKTIFPLVYASRPGYVQEMAPKVLGLIRSFDKQTKETVFKEDIAKLKEVQNTEKALTWSELQDICDRIYSYIHESYLKDTNAYSGINPNKETEEF